MKAFAPLLFLILAIGLFFWYINPTYKEIGTLRNTSSQYAAAIDRANAALQTKNDLLSQYNTIKNDEPKLLKLLPDYVDTIRMIIDLNSIAVKYGTSIKNIQVKDTSTANTTTKSGTIGQDTRPYGTVQISFNVSLPYDQYLQFITDIEHSLPLFNMSTVNFKAADTSNVYDYTITVDTYWLK